MENEKFPAHLFEVDTYHRLLPPCVSRRVVLEACPVKKGYASTPVDDFPGFIAHGHPRSYQEFFELFGWWAIERFDIERVDYGWPEEMPSQDFFEYLHWALHKNDPTGNERDNEFNRRHYMPSGVVARCVGHFDEEGHFTPKKHDLVVVIRFAKDMTAEEFDALYAEYAAAKKAYYASKRGE